MQNKADAQTWPTAAATGAAAGNDMTQWTGSGTSGGDASQWSGSGGDASQWTGAGGDASQWTGAGGAGAGAWDPSQFASMFTIDLEAIRVAHAVLASVCMLIFFPFGGIILRLVPPEEHPHIVWFHAGVQIFAYTVYLAAAGLGIWMAVNYGVVSLSVIPGWCSAEGRSGGWERKLTFAVDIRLPPHHRDDYPGPPLLAAGD
jgi:hypothetical protein